MVLAGAPSSTPPTKLNRNQIRGFWAAWGGWALDGMDASIYAIVLVPALPGFYQSWHDLFADVPVLGSIFDGNPIAGSLIVWVLLAALTPLTFLVAAGLRERRRWALRAAILEQTQILRHDPHAAPQQTQRRAP